VIYVQVRHNNKIDHDATSCFVLPESIIRAQCPQLKHLILSRNVKLLPAIIDDEADGYVEACLVMAPHGVLDAHLSYCRRHQARRSPRAGG
jgi:hypothetical protein